MNLQRRQQDIMSQNLIGQVTNILRQEDNLEKSNDDDLFNEVELNSEGEERTDLQKAAENDLGDLLEKGEITDALFNSYGNKEQITFTKTGKEIKEALPAVISNLQTQINEIDAKKSGLLNKIHETNPDLQPTEAYKSYRGTSTCNVFPYDCCRPAYNGTTNTYDKPTDEQNLCASYNSMSHLCCSMKDDLKALEAMKNHLTDGKKYTLSLPQLLSLGF